MLDCVVFQQQYRILNDLWLAVPLCHDFRSVFVSCGPMGISLFLHVFMSSETLPTPLKSGFSSSQTRGTESTWAGPDILLFCPIWGLHIFRGHQQHVSPLLHDMIQRLCLFSSSLWYSHWQSFLPDHLLCRELRQCQKVVVVCCHCTWCHLGQRALAGCHDLWFLWV